MTRKQALNYLYCSGFSEEQVKTITDAIEADAYEKGFIFGNLVDSVEDKKNFDEAYERGYKEGKEAAEIEQANIERQGG